MLIGMTNRIEGHVLVRDPATGEVLVDRKNSVHYENMSEAIALSLTNRSTGSIHEMVFGNGASQVSAIGAITYFPPNVTSQDARLYHETYYKIINDLSPLNPDPERNRLRVHHTRNNTYTDVVAYCLLDYAEPSGQEAFDDATNLDGQFVFDEIGLRAFNTVPGSGKLLTHVVFHPVQKSLNRQIEIVYTLRIYMS